MTFHWWDDAVSEALGRFTVEGVKHKVRGSIRKGVRCWVIEPVDVPVEVCS